MPAPSRLLIQIVTPNGEVVRIPGGGPLERDLVQTITDQIVTRVLEQLHRASASSVDSLPISVDALSMWRLRSKTAIHAAMKTVIADALAANIRAAVVSQTAPAVAEGVQQAIRDLKDDTRYVWTRG